MTLPFKFPLFINMTARYPMRSSDLDHFIAPRMKFDHSTQVQVTFTTYMSSLNAKTDDNQLQDLKIDGISSIVAVS